MTARRPLLHFVWTGHLPYYCRLAIESAAVTMPDAEITLHLHGSVRRSEHLGPLRRLEGLRIDEVCVPSLFEGCPGGADRFVRLLERLASPAAKSNVLRLGILHRFGGVYLDTDVLVLRPVHDPHDHGTFVGREWVWEQNRRRVAGEHDIRDRIGTMAWAGDWAVRRLDAKVARGRWQLAARPPRPGRSRLQVNNAVIGAPAQAPFITATLEAMHEVDPSVRFALGPSLLDDAARANPTAVQLLPPSRFYEVPPAYSFRYFEDETLELPIDAQVLHVVASNHRRLLARLGERDPRFGRSSAPYWRYGLGVRTAARHRFSRVSVAVGGR